MVQDLSQRSYCLVIVFILAIGGCTWSTKTQSQAHFAPTVMSSESTSPVALNAVLLGSSVQHDAILAITRKLTQKVSQTPRWQRALKAGDCGILALHANDLDVAERMLEEARLIFSSVTDTGEAEISATSLKGAESDKIFKGEPHERVLILIYRGLLFMAHRDYENAQACFGQAALQDALADKEVDRGNWLTADLVLLACMRLLNESSSAEFASALRRRYAVELEGHDELITPFKNPVIVVVGTGRGPEKTVEQVRAKSVALRYTESASRISAVTVTSGPRSIRLLNADNVYVQAVTRGKRNMDAILAKKARTRNTVEALGTGINTGAQIGAGIVPGLGLVGMILHDASMGASDKIDSSADLRQLHSAPGHLHVGVIERKELTNTLSIVAYEGSKVFGKRSISLDTSASGPLLVLGLIPY